MLITPTHNKNPESKCILPNGMDVKPLVSRGVYFMEIWKDIKGFEGRYQVSNLGRLKRLCARKGKKDIIKSLSTSHNGYSQSILHKGGKQYPVRMSRIIAQAFIPNPENKPEVNHINGIKKDNRVCNLEWVTKSENLKHAYKSGLNKPQRGKDNRRSFPVIKLDLLGNELARYSGIREAARIEGIAMSSVQKCCADSTKQLYGFKYKKA